MRQDKNLKESKAASVANISHEIKRTKKDTKTEGSDLRQGTNSQKGKDA